MSQPKFDNLNDVSSKFTNTICYHDNVPVFVKASFHGDNDHNQFLLSVAAYNQESKIVDVHDPAFRYRDYNLGYCNSGVATWWYRRPSRQYQQGLKADQLRFYTETGYGQPKSLFGFQKSYVDMLSNKYMSFEEAQKLTNDGKVKGAAWHRDFALLYNRDVHYIEYRGSLIGTLSKFGSPLIRPEAYYLHEALQEALPK